MSEQHTAALRPRDGFLGAVGDTPLIRHAILEALGATLRKVKAVPCADPNHYQRVAARIAQEIPGALWANQFDNTANRDAHFATTGPEIWHATEGRIDAVVTSAGTGGTLAGVAQYPKGRKPAVRTVLADPPGSALYNYVKTGEVRGFVDAAGILANAV